MTAVFRNPVITDSQGIDHGDPFVMQYNGVYFLYHTGVQAVHAYTSTDLVTWEYQGEALKPGGPDHWAQTDFWAPEVMHHNGTFYMYVAATRKKADGTGDDHMRRQGIARASSPLGPFEWDPRPLVPWDWSIDGHPYRDTDGQLWFFYNIRTGATRYKDGTTGCGNVVERMLAPDKLEGVQAPVAFPSERWEGTREGTWYWNEGPFVLKRRGRYYQMYSGGFYRDDTYGVGVATAPAPMGPWIKYPGNPILRTGTDILGPGHHCVVTGPDGVTPYVVYHGYLPGEKGRKVHIDRLYWAGDRLEIAGPTGTEQPVPAGPVYDPAVPHWHLQAWVTGTTAVAAGVPVALSGKYPHRLQAAKSGDTLRILLDGVLQYVGPGEGPVLQAAGSVEGLTLTSWLEDETSYTLPEGTRRTWAWGGTGSVEVQLAVRGRVHLSAGEHRLTVESPEGQFTRVHFLAREGVDQVTVTGAGPRLAEVTDLVLTAR